VAGLLLATVGYGLTFWAWTLVGPLGWGPQWRSGVGDGALDLLAAVAVVVGSLGRIPVGTLTDRWGPRVLLPVVSVATALAVLALAVLALAALDTGPALAAVAVALGVAGTTFAAGSALVVRCYPPAQRGLALSVFGAGMGVASTAALLLRRVFTVDHRAGLPLLALALLGYAGLAAVLIRDRPVRRSRRAGHWRVSLEVLRLPATRYLSACYAVAFGGLVALGLYLPAYLGKVYGLGGNSAVLGTAACLTLAAITRPFGGWLCRRHDPVTVLRGCFAAGAVISLALAFEPPLAAVAIPALLAMAGFLGLASGAVQATIGATVPPARAGVITGTIGAAGGLAGLPPPLLLAAVHDVNGSYGIGMTLLACAALGAAAYLHRHRRWLSGALAFPATLGAQPAATIVVALPAAGRAGQIIAPLITMASRHEMVIVTVVPDRAHRDHDGYPLLTALRVHLPRHRLVALVGGPAARPEEIALIDDLLADGAVPVVLTTTTNPRPVAAHLAEALHAGQVCLPEPPAAPARSTTAGPKRRPRPLVSSAGSWWR
jgi:NNP family nitrate/nitrite transporter-like MFS transporter